MAHPSDLHDIGRNFKFKKLKKLLKAIDERRVKWLKSDLHLFRLIGIFRYKKHNYELIEDQELTCSITRLD